VGMQAGGERVLVVPAPLAYGYALVILMVIKV
jgi:FKBP-type peptidyl-prolyl cis-trans isomerase